MNKILTSFTLAAALIGTAACTSTKQATLADLSGEWNIVAVNGTDITIPSEQEQPYIGFDTVNGQVFGNSSCNSMIGIFDTSATAGTIDLSNIGSTRMACPDMALEQEIFTALGKVNTYRLTSAGDIELCDEAGTPVITLQKRKPSFSANDLSGTWKITSIDTTDLPADSTMRYTMTFDTTDNRFGCTTDCNTIAGAYKSDYIDIAFDSIAVTEMACDSTTVEQKLLKVLPSIKSFGQLTEGVGFYNSANDLVLIINRD